MPHPAGPGVLQPEVVLAGVAHPGDYNFVIIPTLLLYDVIPVVLADPVVPGDLHGAGGALLVLQPTQHGHCAHVAGPAVLASTGQLVLVLVSVSE